MAGGLPGNAQTNVGTNTSANLYIEPVSPDATGDASADPMAVQLVSSRFERFLLIDIPNNKVLLIETGKA